MGEELDGSSSAAQSARDMKTPKQHETPGLLSRLAMAIRPPEPMNGQVHESQAGRPLTKLGIGNLRNKSVEDVAVPRAEIVSVADGISLDDLVDVFRESGLTRLPVFTDTLDNPAGMIHLKDLSLKHGFKNGNGAFDLAKMVRPVLFVPPSMSIGVLLQKMQAERTHMALVIDEYGGVDGLVTIEDLIEQVLGEIEDEHDVNEEEHWTLERPGCYLAQARAPLEEFESEIGLRLSDDDMDDEIDTLGGLIFMLSGRVPVRGEVVKHSSGTEFEIVDADPRRIKRMRVLIPAAKRSDPDPGAGQAAPEQSADE